eukprot:4007101-Amphidinium_carterae.1
MTGWMERQALADSSESLREHCISLRSMCDRSSSCSCFAESIWNSRSSCGRRSTSSYLIRTTECLEEKAYMRRSPSI